MKTIGIIQSRMSSTRLPGKAMLDLDGETLLGRVINAVKKAKSVDYWFVATSDQPEDDVIADLTQKKSISCFRGSLHDVRSRFLTIGEKEKADILVRVTADNPCTNPEYIDQLVKWIHANPDQHYVMMDPKQVILGTNAEVFRFSALQSVANSTVSDEIEHVTIGMKKKYKLNVIFPEKSADMNTPSLTIDTPEDYSRVKNFMEGKWDK